MLRAGGVNAEPLSRRERGRGEGTAASGEWKSQRRPDSLEDGVEIGADLLIAEADDPHAKALEDLGAVPVVFGKPVVLLAVDLDRELRSVAIEVDDVAIEWNLPFELGAVTARAAQPLPQNLFGASRLAAQASREFDALRDYRPVSSPGGPSPLPLSRTGEGNHPFSSLAISAAGSPITATCLRRLFAPETSRA